MKKYPLILMILVGMMTVFFYSCEKDPSDQVKDEENIILFEDQSLLENISPNFYDNHIYRVELLGNNDELCDLVSAVSDEGISIEDLNIYGAKKHLFNHSSVFMYSVPFNYSDDMVIVYQYDEVSMVMLAQTEHGEEEDLFRMASSDGQLHYSMQVNDRGEFRNIVAQHNPKFERFNSRVYALSMENMADRNGHLKVKDVDCCRRADNWVGCLECTTSAFTSSVIGILSLGLLGKETFAAIAISCINAGPTAVC